jgi:hypothetical protein
MTPERTPLHDGFGNPQPIVGRASPKVHGRTAGKAGPMNNRRLLNGWIA